MNRNKKIPVKVKKQIKLSDYISRHGLTLSLILLFAISFIFFFLFGEGIFFFQANRSMFVFSEEYLQRFTVKPGGLLSYLSVFLTQGYVSSLFGSLLISVLVIIIALTFKTLVKLMSGDGQLGLLLILSPPILLLFAHTRLEYHLQQTLGFCLAALWFLGVVSFRQKGFRRILIFLFPFLYYLAGVYAIVSLGMYITFNIIYEKGGQKYKNILTILIIAVVTWILSAKVLFLQPFKVLIGNPLIFNDKHEITAYLIIIAIIFMLYPVLIKISGSFKSTRITGILPVITIMVIFPLTIFLISRLYNPEISKILKIEKMYCNGEPDKVISHYEEDPSTSIVRQFFYNLALSEKGELCDRMFYGSQSSGPMALSLDGNRDQAFRTMHYYYSIGLINEAHHLAYELMVQHGYTPENIKMLIKTELINGNHSVAERYLNVLKKTILYKKWAEKYEKMLFHQEVVNSDPELGEKARLMPRGDFFISTEDVRNIYLFLKSNPENKKAFEYKLARLLLEKDIIALVDEVHKMKEMGYTRIPRHVQEAVLMYMNYSGESPDLGGLSLNQETETRFIDYVRKVNSYKGNKVMLEKNLKKAEKNSFWYYLQFGVIKSEFLLNKPLDRSIY